MTTAATTTATSQRRFPSSSEPPNKSRSWFDMQPTSKQGKKGGKPTDQHARSLENPVTAPALATFLVRGPDSLESQSSAAVSSLLESEKRAQRRSQIGELAEKSVYKTSAVLLARCWTRAANPQRCRRYSTCAAVRHNELFVFFAERARQAMGVEQHGLAERQPWTSHSG